MESMGPPGVRLSGTSLGTWAPASQFFPCTDTDRSKESLVHDARALSFDLVSRMDDGESGIAHRCGPFFSGRSRDIACPGCRRQRHSAGTCELARAQRFGQRSQRHRQRGQGAGDPVANDHAGDAARRIPSCGLPRAAGAASGKDQTNAICGIEIAWESRRRSRPAMRTPLRAASVRPFNREVAGS